MISETTIQRVRDIPIEDIIGDYVELQRKGSVLMGKCPFHSERTGSFSVTPAKNMFYCFSCHRGGDGIHFIREKEGLGFMEAVEHIARRSGIFIDYVDSERSEAECEAQKRRENMMTALQVAQDFFSERLRADQSEESRVARSYAYGRWPEDFCSAYGIGYAPKDGSALLDHCISRGVEKSTLFRLGLFRSNEDGTEYAFFRERITIPIRDRSGRIIGFTARYTGRSDRAQKYMNSCNSDVFRKSDVVFGIEAARRCRDKSHFIIAEGAPDVLRLRAIGIDNAVAALGTAWSESQFDAVREYTGSVCFIPDSDPPKSGKAFGPGFEAVMKNGAQAIRKGLDVTVRELPFIRRQITRPLFDFEIEDAQRSLLEAKRLRAKKEGVSAKERREMELTDAEAASARRHKVIGEIIGKNDPDEHIRGIDDYNNLEEKHFILWMAEKRFGDVASMAESRNLVRDIAELLAHVRDKMTLDSCIEGLAKINGRPKLWRDAVDTARKELRSKADDKSPKSQKQKDAELLRKFNLSISDNQYWTLDGDDDSTRLSNFILEPLYHIQDEYNGTRLFRMVNTFDESRVIELKEAELCSLATFQQRVGSLGNFVWRAKIDKLNNVKEYVYARTDSAQRIKRLGWDNENRFFAFGNGILVDGKFLKVDELGIVRGCRDNSFYLPATARMYANNPEIFQFERQMIHENTCGIRLYDYAEKLVEVFGHNARIAICFLLAAMFRDIVFRRTGHFPLLNLFGEKGTGKTSLATCLQSFFIHSDDPPQLGLTTIPAMNDKISQAVNTLVVFDEYKNDLDTRKIAFLKGMWGGAGQTKKNANAGNMATQTIVTNAVAICGQDKPTQDMALFTRVLFLGFSKPEFQMERQRRFDEVKALSNLGMTHLTVELMNHREVFEKNFAQAFDLVRSELAAKVADEKIHARILGNWIIPLAAFRALETSVELPFSYAELFETALAGMRKQNEYSAESSEVADFWEQMQGLQTEGKCVENAHYKIRYTKRFRPIGADQDVVFEETKPILYLNGAAVATLFNGGHAISSTANRSNWSTILSYLKSHGSFLGLKQDRFVILSSNGRPEYVYDKTMSGIPQQKTKVNRPKALCFDYSMLKKEFHLNLETEIISDAEAFREDSDNGRPHPSMQQQLIDD